MKKILVSLLFVTALFSFTWAETAFIKGKVSDLETGEPLIGANVQINNERVGSITDENGNYEIRFNKKGEFTLLVTFIGYSKGVKSFEIKDGETIGLDFELKEVTIFGNAIEVVANRAIDRRTPVAFTNVSKKEVQARLGSRDIPMVLNTTPSVYATEQGGGAGDARVNIRGFDQRNVAIMINGVPVNDMENGWVYWSNWDGVGDATSDIQVQRGLSAVNLSTPSIGGIMNIITDPAQYNYGTHFRQEYGSGNFKKTTASFNSGLINDKLAFNGLIVRKTAEGVIDKAWTDSWAYYFGASWNINKNNRLEFYAVGAPQRHGQNIYKQNIGVYDKDFAEDLDGYSHDAFDKFHEKGRRYNQNWAPVDNGYTGLQYFAGKKIKRHDDHYINSRENYYHKPQVNLNWYSNLMENLNLYSVLYFSGGEGGGTGTYGDLAHQSYEGAYDHSSGKYYYFGSPWAWDWNATIAINRDSTHCFIDKEEFNKEKGQSIGILRNSCNNQWSLGLIEKATYKFNDKISFDLGLDWRTAQIEHFREVRDLLGGDYFISSSDQFETTLSQREKTLGDKIDYNFTNTVDWFGGYLQGEYTNGVLSFYGMGGMSMVKYTHENHFKTKDTLSDGSPDVNSGEMELETDWISGFQTKAGVSYRLTENFDIYSNAGYVQRVPVLDFLIDDRASTKTDDPKNESFIHLEGGLNFWALKNQLNLKMNFYHTDWKDKPETELVNLQDGTEGIIFFEGMDVRHQGIELEGAYRPIKQFQFGLAASFGNWYYLDDVDGSYKTYTDDGYKTEEYRYSVKDIKVGDAPQTQFAVMASYFPVEGLMAQAVYKYYSNHYAQFDPFDRQVGKDDDGNWLAPDREESWEAPDYGVLDLHFTYDLPLDLKNIRVQVFAHIYNALNEVYIQDAVDNSPYNAYTDNGKDHSADDAEVFFGKPRWFNTGININF